MKAAQSSLHRHSYPHIRHGALQTADTTLHTALQLTIQTTLPTACTRGTKIKIRATVFYNSSLVCMFVTKTFQALLTAQVRVAGEDESPGVEFPPHLITDNGAHPCHHKHHTRVSGRGKGHTWSSRVSLGGHTVHRTQHVTTQCRVMTIVTYSCTSRDTTLRVHNTNNVV